MADDEFQEVLQTVVNERVNPDLRPRVNRSFRKVRSVVGDYAQLVSGHGYNFRAFPNPVEPVAHARTPLIPMLISIVPPDNYPTGETVTRKIPAPASQDIALTTLTERFRPQAGGARNINRIIPTSPEAAERIAEIQDQIEEGNLSDQEEQALQEEARRLRRDARYIEVEVPANTQPGREQQVERTDEYLRNLRNRYNAFKEASRGASNRIEALNTDIVGPQRSEVVDPFNANKFIREARNRQVAGDLAFLRQQAEKLRDLPPLFMYINPTTFSKSYERIIAEGHKVRHGYSIEDWGEQLVTINATGKVGAFYIDANDKLGNPAGGLAVSARKGSYAYQQFLSLFQVYRNNGYIYNTHQRISIVGAVSIFYDGKIYTGSFDSFSITQSEEMPFTFDYNFSFTVRFEQSIREL